MRDTSYKHILGCHNSKDLNGESRLLGRMDRKLCGVSTNVGAPLYRRQTCHATAVVDVWPPIVLPDLDEMKERPQVHKKTSRVFPFLATRRVFVVKRTFQWEILLWMSIKNLQTIRDMHWNLPWFGNRLDIERERTFR